MQTWNPLPREDIVKAIEKKRPSRIPLIHAKDWGEGLVEQYGDRLNRFDKYPEDAECIMIKSVNPDAMGLSWQWDTGGAHDACAVIDEWSKLDEFIEKLPDPEKDPQFDKAIEQARIARERDLYVIFGWWRLFFERPWALRGMENLMVDYYFQPDNVHRLHEALLGVYIAYLRRAVREIKPDGFWTSDDLGHQTSLMMSPDVFRRFIKPYYKRLGDFIRKNNLHWWLHSCGNNTEIMADLVEVGVTVFHPVQKGTMDELAVAREFGDKLTFLVGFDVQHVLQEADTEGVRREVRFLIDTFDEPCGGMCIAAGNGIVAGTPIENIEAFLDEALVYGTAHRRRLNGKG